MGKSEDSIIRRRNRKCRKKKEDKSDSSSKVSSRVAAIIAAKKRRLTGKRRLCQGMCFSLPTPDDPFNDRKGNPEPVKKTKRKSTGLKKLGNKENDPNNGSSQDIDDCKITKPTNSDESRAISTFLKCIGFMVPEITIDLGKTTKRSVKLYKSSHSRNNSSKDSDGCNIDCPSQSLVNCLSSIQNAVNNDPKLLNGGEKFLFAYPWGLDFWNCYHRGKDVLEIGTGNSSIEQIAWIASTAADDISRKKKEHGTSFNRPFLLVLVPSQEKASEVRSVCKPLKPHGIHTVSLHPGASIDHEMDGLRRCEPEIIVSTPDRLLELVRLNAVDLSGVSLLAVEGVETEYVEALKSIRMCCISGDVRIVLFCDMEKKW